MFHELDYFCIDEVGLTTRKRKSVIQPDRTTWAYLNLRFIILSGHPYNVLYDELSEDKNIRLYDESYPWDLKETMDKMCNSLCPGQLPEERIMELAFGSDDNPLRRNPSLRMLKLTSVVETFRRDADNLKLLRYGLTGAKRIYTVRYKYSTIRQLMNGWMLLRRDTPIRILRTVTTALAIPSSVIGVNRSVSERVLHNETNLDTIGKCLLFGNYYRTILRNKFDEQALTTLKRKLDSCLCTFFAGTNLDDIWYWLMPYNETIDLKVIFNDDSIFINRTNMARPIYTELLAAPSDLLSTILHDEHILRGDIW